jgi:hypothetical protein
MILKFYFIKRNNIYTKYLLSKCEGIGILINEILENLNDYIVSNHNANFSVLYSDKVWETYKIFHDMIIDTPPYYD